MVAIVSDEFGFEGVACLCGAYLYEAVESFGVDEVRVVGK
jgi:hypothetical protein